MRLPLDRVVLSWSGGKDSALALHELRDRGGAEVAALVTTITEGDDRVGMHRVRRELLELQADAVGVPLAEVRIPAAAPNTIYEERLGEVLARYRLDGVTAVAFGDLFLEEIREYRERFLAGSGFHGVYPLWQRDTSELARTFVDLGFRAVLVCVDTRVLPASFAGREYDEALLADLPAGVDPCGENGEFHTFAYDGPIFRRPVGLERGGVELRDSFSFRDLLPVGS
jgi:uncharacterized protein (TIGR00290 family)